MWIFKNFLLFVYGMSLGSIPKNGILALARGSHLRRVFPVLRDYKWQSNTALIIESEVQPKWRNPSVCPHICGLVLHIWSSPFGQKSKEGLHYANQWQPEHLFYLRSQHQWEGDGHRGKGTAKDGKNGTDYRSAPHRCCFYQIVTCRCLYHKIVRTSQALELLVQCNH